MRLYRKASKAVCDEGIVIRSAATSPRNCHSNSDIGSLCFDTNSVWSACWISPTGILIGVGRRRESNASARGSFDIERGAELAELLSGNTRRVAKFNSSLNARSLIN